MSPRPLDRRTAESLLSGHAVDGEAGLTAFVADLRDLGTAPDPSAALYVLLTEGFTPDPDAHVVRAVTWTRGVTWTRAAAVLGAAALALTGGAAANALPRPVQNAVADVVEAVTPISVLRSVAPPAPAVPADDDRGESEDVRQDGTGTDDTLQRDEDNGGGGRGSGSGSGRSDDAPGQDDHSGSGSGSGKSDDAPGKDDHSGSRSGSGSGTDDQAPARSGSGSSSSSESGSGSGKDAGSGKTDDRVDGDLSGKGATSTDDHGGSGSSDDD